MNAIILNNTKNIYRISSKIFKIITFLQCFHQCDFIFERLQVHQINSLLPDTVVTNPITS